MSLETWVAYVTACFVLSVIPGPSVLIVIGQALARGLRAALSCVAGNLLGGVVVVAASYAGLGVLLATSALAFAVLKWAGVAYLAWLGLSQIRQARALGRTTAPDIDIDMNGDGQPPGSGSPRSDRLSGSRSGSLSGSLRAGFFTGVLNPKAIVFYMSFLAQFIDPALPHLPQFLILTLSSSLVAGLVLAGHALLAARAAASLSSPRARRRMGYAGGTCLLGGSMAMAVTR